mmetsp:Transcript_93865/g.238928  ORF Transcript_93865/g.238928 Transcript_93865/m.238928 type:complete len:261 (+) Transcript_93865:294-1076(+)
MQRQLLRLALRVRDGLLGGLQPVARLLQGGLVGLQRPSRVVHDLLQGRACANVLHGLDVVPQTGLVPEDLLDHGLVDALLAMVLGRLEADGPQLPDLSQQSLDFFDELLRAPRRLLRHVLPREELLLGHGGAAREGVQARGQLQALLHHSQLLQHLLPQDALLLQGPHPACHELGDALKGHREPLRVGRVLHDLERHLGLRLDGQAIAGPTCDLLHAMLLRADDEAVFLSARGVLDVECGNAARAIVLDHVLRCDLLQVA